MFEDKMLAPCGLDCSLCSKAYRAEKPCPGCHGEDEYKSKYCSTCGIALCKLRPLLPDDFCDKCPQYPCADIMEKQNRYTTQYPLVENPIDNLVQMRKIGITQFMDNQRKQWSCECGGVFCVYNGVCSKCGKVHTK
ncbi:MAG: DUF3795 domain-containing protein [Clostridia bacterium]|nr:DUF3795 domain-containing protein [Clostridia bacterium]